MLSVFRWPNDEAPPWMLVAEPARVVIEYPDGEGPRHVGARACST